MQPKVDKIVSSFGGKQELPFTKESELKELLSYALVAIECENSLWKAEMMPDFGRPLKVISRLGGKMGLPKNAVLPTVILKEEDIAPLDGWQKSNHTKIHIWHVFYDRAYGISFDQAEQAHRRRVNRADRANVPSSKWG